MRLHRNVTGGRYNRAVPDRRPCESACRFRRCRDRTSLDGTNCPTAARVSLAGHGLRVIVEVTLSPTTHVGMQLGLSMASGLHKEVESMLFRVGGDIDAERYGGIAEYRLFPDGNRPLKPYPHV
jgi:hypothetical protein